ncbi:MAG: hypothetical protein JWQ99_3869 [Blastococcus sp.]|nr:hypothetical protein [Blastococcus sp.]
MSKALDRVADAGGIVHVLLVFGGFVFLVAPHLPASLDDPAAALAHLQAHPPTTAFWAGVWLEGAGLLALVLLAARVASRIRAARPGWWVPSAVVGLAIAGVTVKVGSFAPGLAALEIDRLDATAVTALLGVNDSSVAVAAALDGTFVLLLGLGVLATGALPRWLSAGTIVAGAGLLVATAVPALDSLLLLFYVWAVTVSGWLLARGSRTAVTAEEPAFAG